MWSLITSLAAFMGDQMRNQGIMVSLTQAPRVHYTWMLLNIEIYSRHDLWQF